MKLPEEGIYNFYRHSRLITVPNPVRSHLCKGKQTRKRLLCVPFVVREAKPNSSFKRSKKSCGVHQSIFFEDRSALFTAASLLFVGIYADNRRNLFKVQINGLVFRDTFNVLSGRLSEAVLRDRELVALDSEFRTALQDNADRHFSHCPPPRFLPLRSRP